ncbi:21174_t:CDS:1, partial [Racocetra persica]
DPDNRPDIKHVCLDLKKLITNDKQSISNITQDPNTLETHRSTRLDDQGCLFISDSTDRILMQ